MTQPLQKTILVIEDDTAHQDIYRLLLTKAGYNVIVRAEAAAGLRWLEQILPDLILLDVMLPGMSGLDMLKAIRTSPNGQTVPILIASALSLGQEDFSSFNVTAILEKPILPPDLLGAVKKLLDD